MSHRPWEPWVVLNGGGTELDLCFRKTQWLHQEGQDSVRPLRAPPPHVLSTMVSQPDSAVVSHWSLSNHPCPHPPLLYMQPEGSWEHLHQVLSLLCSEPSHDSHPNWGITQSLLMDNKALSDLLPPPLTSSLLTSPTPQYTHVLHSSHAGLPGPPHPAQACFYLRAFAFTVLSA